MGTPTHSTCVNYRRRLLYCTSGTTLHMTRHPRYKRKDVSYQGRSKTIPQSNCQPKIGNAVTSNKQHHGNERHQRRKTGGPRRPPVPHMKTRKQEILSPRKSQRHGIDKSERPANIDQKTRNGIREMHRNIKQEPENWKSGIKKAIER